MVMRESALSHRAAEETLPLRDAFAVLFFVSVGMLFQPAVVFERPWQLAAVVAIILLGKTLAAALLVLAFRYPLNTALTVSASLAQIGDGRFLKHDQSLEGRHDGRARVCGVAIAVRSLALMLRSRARGKYTPRAQAWLRARRLEA